MTTIDLIVLGILQETPVNAYELAHYIEERQINRVLKISRPAVYKSCKRLFKSGFLDGAEVRGQGVPDKVIYTVNSAGKAHFIELMAYFSQNVKPFFLEFNSVLWNIEKLDAGDGLKVLESLKTELYGLKDWIIEHEKEVQCSHSFAAKAIVKQYRMVLITLVNWVDGILGEYKQMHKLA